ncbi:TonB-dependent receptor [Balneolales bacterium ANBcel1]|nr:TonB-dependent receptor [Balneolales bacterium ANBcel1]
MLLLLTAGVSNLAAQTISGTVRDAQTREPLQGATIYQLETGQGTTTDAQGNFALTLLEGGRNIVEVRFLGYETRRITVDWSGERNEVISLIPEAIMREELLVEAFRVDERSPVTYTNVNREEIEERNLGKDIPVLLEMSPSVISTSDAGAGIGYTGLRIRGVDPQRINVTVNGIPLNDSESHGVFWVNMPDFASSVENIQIQRGVGTSSHGPAAFGATVNLQTTTLRPDAYGEINSSAGAFNTFKNNIRVGTGLMSNGWAFDGRLSRITSDGYIDRASSDLRSFFVSGTRHSESGVLKLNVFSGQEETYQAWYGVDRAQLEENRRFNPAGMYTGPDGETRFYDNQTDNYTQTHYQLHYSRRLSEQLNGNISLHYTRGAGYYEEFRSNNALSAYGFSPVMVGSETVTHTDLVRQRWLDNHFGGLTFSFDYDASDRLSVIMGGGINHYDGDHFGEIIWARVATPSELGERYYDNTGVKTDRNAYVKVFYDVSDRLSILGDLQLRNIYYTLDGINNDQRVLDDSHSYTFFNPKTGLSYDLGEIGRLYGYFGISSKEPVRRDFTDATENYQPKHETLYNVEAGYRGGTGVFQFGVNAFYMWYDNQLINTGEINDVGDPVRTNVPESYRMGLELEAAAQLMPGLRWNGNVTLSRNRIPEFVELIDRYDENWAFDGQQERIHTDTDIAFSPAVVSASQLSWRYGNARVDWYARYVGRQYLDNTSNRDRALDPWWINDLRFEWAIGGLQFVRNVRLQVMFNNILDHKYESNGYTFGYFAGDQEIRETYYFPQAGRHVMGGITVAF